MYSAAIQKQVFHKLLSRKPDLICLPTPTPIFSTNDEEEEEDENDKDEDDENNDDEEQRK